MGIDGDILVSCSPPIFAHNASANFYNTYGGNCRLQNQANNVPRQRLKSPNRVSANNSRLTNESSLERKPSRPCLVIRPDENSSGSSSSSDENEPQSPIRRKKKVVFADDRGFSLTQIRLMVESPTESPNSTFSQLSIKENIDYSPKLANTWKIMFSQPASNYLEFRKRLDTVNVSLENVIIKTSENELTGTIKVKNICFEKTVFVRYTMNEWKDYTDVNSTFVDNNTSKSITIIYDTFSFKLSLSTEKDKLEFCVCFKSTNGEYWDNNNGKNYVICKNNDDHNVGRKHEKYRTPVIRANTWPTYTWNSGGLQFPSSSYW